MVKDSVQPSLFSLDYFMTQNTVRTNNVANYCSCQFIKDYLNMLFEKLPEDIKKIKSKEDMTKFLAYYYSELNLIRPFEKDNEKVIINYLKQVIEFVNSYANFDFALDFSQLNEEDKTNLEQGFIDSYTDGDLELLNKFFSSTLKEDIKEHQK